MDLPSPALPAVSAPPHATAGGAWARLPPRVQQLLRWTGLSLGVWLVPGFLSAMQLYFILQVEKPGAFSCVGVLVWQVPPWLVWGAATPLILALGRRWPLEAGRWRAGLPPHLLGLVLIGAVHAAAVVLCSRLAHHQYYPAEPFWRVWAHSAIKGVHQVLLLYGGVLALGAAREYYGRYREGALAQAKLQAQLAHAQLDALKMQLHPHFLFNVLNAIAVLVRKQDTAGAVRVVTGVGELLRLALHNTGRQTVPLRQELDFIERYLALEQTRFQDRLQVHRSIEPSALDAAVPNLLLQPLVENALKHGIGARAAAGRVELGAWRRGEWLHLEVRDDGPGLRPGWEEGEGIGLANVRARLAQQYGQRHALRVEPHPEGGVRVVVELPFALERRA